MHPCHWLVVAVVLVLSGCASPTGRAAKRSAAALGNESAAAGVSVTRAQADNAGIAADAAKLSAGDRAIRTDAQRIDDKAVILLRQ